MFLMQQTKLHQPQVMTMQENETNSGRQGNINALSNVLSIIARISNNNFILITLVIHFTHSIISTYL